MILHSADVSKDHVVVVIGGFKKIDGLVTLKGDYSTQTLEAFLTDEQGKNHPLSAESLVSLKPEIAQWLDRVLSKRIQEFASELGAHVRVTKDQDDAILLLRLYRQIK